MHEDREKNRKVAVIFVQAKLGKTPLLLQMALRRKKSRQPV